MPDDANPGPGYVRHPDHMVALEPCAKRIRARFAGATIADTTRALLMRESRHTPVYYLPRADVRMELLDATDHQTECPFKGTARYWTITVGARRSQNAVWGYDNPYAEVRELKDYVAFYWNRLECWLEEDEEVFVHARDPRVRIDVLRSSRAVTIKLKGITIADSRTAVFLFETGLPPRYYIPLMDVRRDLLRPSETRTSCPYKGTAVHWSIEVEGDTIRDIAWSYPAPLPEVAKMKDHLCFYPDKVDSIEIAP